MNKQTTIRDQNVETHGKKDSGFTLVEILIAIVLVGVLSAVAVVGINSLTSSGSDSACTASLDAAKAASVVYFASNANTYPVNFTELTSGGDDAALELPSGVAVDGKDPLLVKAGDSWTLTMTPGTDGAKPTFACS